MGFYHADGGASGGRDSAVHIKNPKDAQLHGIGMVYQHFTLVENMTVAENLVLSRAHVPGLIDWKKEHAALDAFMAKDAIFDLAHAARAPAGCGRGSRSWRS